MVEKGREEEMTPDERGVDLNWLLRGPRRTHRPNSARSTYPLQIAPRPLPYNII